ALRDGCSVLGVAFSTGLHRCPERPIMIAPRCLRPLLPALAGLLPAVVSAQTSLYTKSGDAGNDRLGLTVRSAGDVNQDGHPDFIAGAPQDGNVFSAVTGYARVFSGIDG